MQNSNTNFDDKHKNNGIKKEDIVISKVEEKKSERS